MKVVSRFSSRPRSSSTSSGSAPRSDAISAMVRLASPSFFASAGTATTTRSQLPWKMRPGRGVARLVRNRRRNSGSRNTGTSCSGVYAFTSANPSWLKNG